MSTENLPDHLIPLPDETTGRWALWRTVCVRGAGFPASRILKIADAECAAAADHLNAIEAEAERLRESALEALRSELEAAGKDRLDPIVKAIRKVKRSQPVAAAEGLAAATVAALEAWKEAAERAGAEKKQYESTFAAAEERLHEALRELAQDERFHEAMVWQNRQAAETGLRSFLRRPAGSGRGSARDRGHVQMLASYFQRYCTKNDSIGFFGPVGWGRLSESDEVVAVEPGEDLLASRHVFFEGWAIDAIADRLAEDEAMRPWLAPRRTPFLRREGNAFVAPDGRRIELPPPAAELLAACDGTRSARELIRRSGPLPAEQEAMLLGLLADFHAKGIVRWGFQIPLSGTPERTLRESLQSIGEEPLRERALATLDEIERGRDAVIAAAGKADELDRALSELEATFTRVTGRPASRASGGVYSGRTLVYEDCRRDLELDLGASFLAELAAPLSLVLASGRWYCHHVGTGMRELFAQVWAELRPQGGAEPMDLLAFAQAALPRLLSAETGAARTAELNARWSRVLAIPDGQRRVHYRSEDLRPRVLREFAAPGAGWQHGRCHSPDLLIAASSLDAIRQGDYQIVLGEVHVALNTLDRHLFFSVHPEPEQLKAAIEADLPKPLVRFSVPKIWNQETASSRLGLPTPATAGRMSFASQSAKDFYLDFSLDPPAVPPSQVLAISELSMEPADGGFVVKPRDGRASFDAVDFFQYLLMLQVLNTFQVMPEGTYTPRITIDRMVLIRESWTFRAGELGFAQEETPEARFAGARHWAERLGLPRFVFAKTTGERKPTYLDFASPVLVELFAKGVRKAAGISPEATVRLSEMIPEHDRLWLPDAQGNLYTCELRLVALDLE